jgi:hypothetical protein
MGSAEGPHGLVESRGLFEAAHVSAAGDHHQSRIGNPAFELPSDAQRRTCVLLAPDQQRRYGDLREQVALVGLRQQGELDPETPWANVGRDVVEQRDELGRRIAANSPARWDRIPRAAVKASGARR